MRFFASEWIVSGQKTRRSYDMRVKRELNAFYAKGYFILRASSTVQLSTTGVDL